MRDLYTIGYSGFTVDSFIAELQSHGIKVVLDIRMNPISRKRGFSKKKLEESLSEAGIQYIHSRDLGSPKALRDTYYANKEYQQFFDSFRSYLTGQTDAIAQAVTLAAHDDVCLMCVEETPGMCHRHIVADTIVASSDMPMQVHHLAH